MSLVVSYSLIFVVFGIYTLLIKAMHSIFKTKTTENKPMSTKVYYALILLILYLEYKAIENKLYVLTDLAMLVSMVVMILKRNADKSIDKTSIENLIFP